MTVLGIDIAKKTFDATLIEDTGRKRGKEFKNNESGFKQLQTWVAGYEPGQLHVCMEATSIYWEELAEFLHGLGHVVSVVNPARIKGHAMSQLRRSKTDPIDGDVIADFCLVQEPNAWTPPTAEERKLRALVRHLETLKKTRTQQRNRLSTARDPEVRSSLEVVLDTLATEIERIEQRIQGFIDDLPDLKEKQELLASIQGIGDKTAAHIIAEMYDLEDYKSAKAAAADAGVTTSHFSSGSSVRRRPKISRMGKASIRGALYLPALTAMKHNPIVRALAERLEAKGKPKKVIIVAAMRKLMHLAYGVLKNKKLFDPNYASA